MNDERVKREVETVWCDDCETPTARIINGALVIESRHHSGKHKTVLSLEWLRSKLEALSRPPASADSK